MGYFIQAYKKKKTSTLEKLKKYSVVLKNEYISE